MVSLPKTPKEGDMVKVPLKNGNGTVPMVYHEHGFGNNGNLHWKVPKGTKPGK